MPDLNIISNFTATIKGSVVSERQGTDEDAADSDAFALAIDGEVHRQAGSLATGAALKVWDDDTHRPLTLKYFWVKADQDIYVQVIGAATNYIVVVTAGVPFSFSGNTMLAAADTTAISGSAPSVAEIDSVVIQNNSGSAANYSVVAFS